MADKNKEEFDLISFGDQVSKLIEQFWKPVLGLMVVGIVVWGGLITKDNLAAKEEKKAFDELFAITNIYNERASDFEEAKLDAERKELDKDKPKASKNEKDADQDKEDKPKPVASGDLQKDYGDVVEKLEAYIKKYPDKKATGEAALTLASIYDEYKEAEKAAAIISSTVQKWPHRDLLYVVMQMRAGDLWSKVGDCEKSVPYWKVLSEKENFLQAEATLKIGVCYQKIGKLDLAKSWYQKLTSKDQTSPQAKSAEKYLRYLDFQKKLDTKETTKTTATDNNKES